MRNLNVAGGGNGVQDVYKRQDHKLILPPPGDPGGGPLFCRSADAVAYR